MTGLHARQPQHRSMPSSGSGTTAQAVPQVPYPRHRPDVREGDIATDQYDVSTWGAVPVQRAQRSSVSFAYVRTKLWAICSRG